FLQILDSDGLQTACKKFGISNQIAMKHLVPEEYKKKGSMPQDQLAKELSRLTGIEFEQNVRSIVPGNNRLEIDILNRELKISIEFNGAFWHHEDRIKDDIQKAKIMREHGWNHIVVDEAFYWQHGADPIANLIKPKKTIHAHNLAMRSPQKDEIRTFLDTHHIQGYAPYRAAYGLYDGNQLIQVMTFGKPRYSKKHEWEILRLASHSDYRVTGGAERLFNRFLTEHDPKSIIAYCDFRFFSGNVYERLGMSLASHDDPGYVWYDYDTKNVFPQYQTQKHKLPKLLGESFDPSLTEVQNMENAGYVQCNDLGQLMFEWRA
ncbi:MAG: hypothetical protein D6698_11465, partial [Gammaproteobacteria bacterium]